MSKKIIGIFICMLFFSFCVTPDITGKIEKINDESESDIDEINNIGDVEHTGEHKNLLNDFPGEQWNHTFGRTNYDAGYSVQQTTDKGYIITGSTGSHFTGYNDVWLIKTDTDGNEQWNQTFGGPSFDWGNCVQQTNDEGYIITGWTASYGSGYGDVWLIKTDTDGNEQWNRTFGGTDYDVAASVEQTTDGGYVLTGCTNSYSIGYCDAWLVKTDSNGDEQWNRTFGGAEYDNCISVHQTTDGGYILAGTTYSYGAGYDDGWLIKTDSNGDEQWNRTFGTTNYDATWSVQQTNDGGYILTGSTYSFGAVYWDVWLIKTDYNGDEEWNRTFGGANNEKGYSVHQTTDGGYIIAGNTSSYGSDNSDAWLIKTDFNGNEEWSKILGGTNFDMGISVQQTTDGGYIIAGNTSSYGSRNSSVWLIKIAPEIIPQPDLECSGELSWNNVKAGSTVVDNFVIENIGDPESRLNWEIIEVPDWGEWTFTPSCGQNLTPENGQFTIQVEVIAPEDKNTEFIGEVNIANQENSSDCCGIDIVLKTPKNKPLNFNLTILNYLFYRFQNVFPILRYLLVQ